MKQIDINVELMNEDAVMPQYAHETDSGFDLFTCKDTVIKAGCKAIVSTGLKFEIPYGYGIQLKNKSGITSKGCPIYSYEVQAGKENEQEISLTSIKTLEGERADITVFEGTIDMTYRGELGIMVKNEEYFDITIPKHTKLAQGVIREIITAKFNKVDKVSTDTDRGEKGYGSSGTSK